MSNDKPQPFQLSLVFDFSKQSVNISGTLNKLADVKDALKFARLMTSIYASRKFELRGQSDELLLSTPEPTGKPPDLFIYDKWVALLENASFIQERLGVRIPSPESPTSYDLELSSKLREFIQNGRIELQHVWCLGA